MGINSLCYIPNDVKASDIVQAIAYLCGAERIEMNLGNGGIAANCDLKEVQTCPGKFAKHVYVTSTHEMQYFIVSIAPTTCDRISHMASLFLYPSEYHLGYFHVHAGVSEFWHAIDRALVDIFGGWVDDNDCDLVEVDYKKEKPRPTNCPYKDDEWNEFLLRKGLSKK